MKHKKVKRGMVRRDTIFPLYNQVDGEWYATITARYAAADAEPIVVIAGPFADVEKAKAHNRKCESCGKAIKGAAGDHAVLLGALPGRQP